MDAKRKNEEESERRDEPKRRQLVPAKGKSEGDSVPSKEAEDVEKQKKNDEDEDEDTDKQEDEDEEEQDVECEDCGAYLDEEEAEIYDGLCHRCYTMIRVNRIRARLPSNYSIREVLGDHRKPCSDCGTETYYIGDWYVFDGFQPRGTDKYCMDCAEVKDWSESDDESDY